MVVEEPLTAETDNLLAGALRSIDLDAPEVTVRCALAYALISERVGQLERPLALLGQLVGSLEMGEEQLRQVELALAGLFQVAGDQPKARRHARRGQLRAHPGAEAARCRPAAREAL